MSKTDIQQLIKAEIKEQMDEVLQGLKIQKGFSETNFEALKKTDVDVNEKRFNSVILLGVPTVDLGSGDHCDDDVAVPSILRQFGADGALISSITKIFRKGEVSDSFRPVMVEFADERAATKVVKGNFGKFASFGGSSKISIKYHRTKWLRDAYKRMFATLEFLSKTRPDLKPENRYGVAYFNGWRIDPRDFKRPVIRLRKEEINIDEIVARPEFKRRFQYSALDD